MKEVLSHSLGTIPWSLATSDGTLRKIKKTVLRKNLEKESTRSEKNPENSACIIVAETLFRKAMSEKESCNRVDFVFDVYKQKSIKNAERRKRGNFVSFLFCE